MPMTSKQKSLKHRQRRVGKLRLLKAKLLATQDSRTRERLIGKIRRLSPLEPVPKK